jgi:DNA topoisomerase-1
MVESNELTLSPRKIRAILQDPEKCAQAINLQYVTDQEPGIVRVKKGDEFEYVKNKRRLRNKLDLNRIHQLAIPPAWREVWICSLANGHLQATGIDSKNRKQYKYHPLWSKLRNQTKFYRLYDFGLALPIIRQQLQKDLSRRGLPVEKVLATVVWLMSQTSIRIGNSVYEKLYESFGLTTLKDKHVNITGNRLTFRFKGKKGIAHNISISNPRLARIVKQCRDIPGKELFQFYDEEGNHRRIESGMVNDYIKSITGNDFTAKDFRTWAGTVQALIALLTTSGAETKTEIKNNVLQAVEQVAAHLGNTRAICKKYYIHPLIIDLYENNLLEKYLADETNPLRSDQNHDLTDDLTDYLTDEEKILMKILNLEKVKSICVQH